MPRKPYQVIEQGSRGATYQNDDNTFTVYEIGTYERSSVLAGRQKRTWLDEFPSLEAAKAAYPQAEFIEGSTYIPNSQMLAGIREHNEADDYRNEGDED